MINYYNILKINPEEDEESKLFEDIDAIAQYFFIINILIIMLYFLNIF